MADTKTHLRDEYKEQTRDRILNAAAELICERGEDQITIERVAARARVSDRTVFRHFRNRANLIRSVWEGLRQRIGPPPTLRNANELIDAPLILYPRYDEEQELLRAYLDSRRKRLNPDAAVRRLQEVILSCLRNELHGLEEGELRRRAAIAHLLISPDACDWMRRLWDLDGNEAGQAAMEALEALLGLYPADD